MTNNEIQEVLVNVLKNRYQEGHHEEYPNEITPWTKLDYFAFDSLDKIEAVIELERALDVKIYDDIIESNFKNSSTINDMTLAIASLNPRYTTDWYKTKFPNKKATKTAQTKTPPIIELYELNSTTLQFRQGGKVLNLYDEKVQPYINMLRNELEKQTQK